MNDNIEPLYNLIKSRMDRYIFQNVLGDNVAMGIEKFHEMRQSLSGGEEINYAELIVESLDSEISDLPYIDTSLSGVFSISCLKRIIQ